MLDADGNFGGWPDLDLLLRLLDALARVGGALGAEPAVRCVRFLAAVGSAGKTIQKAENVLFEFMLLS